MKTRRIQAADIQAALREVRRTLGEDAVILSTRELSEGIEIMAAKGITGIDTSRPKRTSRPTLASGLAALGASLARPRKLPTPANSKRTLEQLDVLNINQDLDALGLSADVRKSLLGQLEPGSGTAWINASKLLSQSLLIDGKSLLKQGGRVAILGPAGVGKTTTIAKLAAHYTRRYGAGQVALVNTDCYRIGAAEQLRSYGRLMGVQVHQLPDARGLGEILKRLDKKRLVLIDTVGNSHEDPVLTQQILATGSGLKPVLCYLAMSFNTQIAALEKTVRNFSRLPLAGSILTKEDEAVSMGANLSIVLRHELPVAFITTGVRVPMDIRTGNAERLVDAAFKLIDKTGVYASAVKGMPQRAEARP